MQGFICDGMLRVYDPGFRFPGTEFDLLFIQNLNINLIKKMIYFSIYGEIPSEYGTINHQMAYFNDKFGMELWPCVRKGTIKTISGFDSLHKIHEIVCFTLRHKENETIFDYRNVNQRLAEIDIICDDINRLKTVINDIYSMISCLDVNGEEMIYNKLDTNKF